MPGQRKRKRKQAPADLGPGRWDVIFETQDFAEWREHVRRYRAEDPKMIRLDTFCGREVVPTTYRMSRFVPDPAADQSAD